MPMFDSTSSTSENPFRLTFFPSLEEAQSETDGMQLPIENLPLKVERIAGEYDSTASENARFFIQTKHGWIRITPVLYDLLLTVRR